MASAENRNDFLLELLAFQQDGRQAISAPSNWITYSPLLEVTTEVDNIVEELQKAILSSGGRNDTARWHFFIGSPGNGKSAAMGKLCRQMLSTGTCQVRDEKGIAIQDLDPTSIPYAINVYEGDNKFASAQIVQDASVVRNPFSREVDPARELLHTLEEAWRKGISLIVCTNRGVLEKAHRDNHTNQSVNSTPWFKILTAVVSANTSSSSELSSPGNFDNKKAVFKRLSITYSHMDNRSLLLRRDTFDRLFQRAADTSNWDCCESCGSHRMCPFKANRDWLAGAEPRERVLKLLRRAEVLSGQVIVFREALALVALILAGCARDYDGTHPCEWVRSKATAGDVFSLAARRIYMCLFTSHCPYGLEASDPLRKRQLEALRVLHDVLKDVDVEATAAVHHVISAHPPSIDVGVTRLLGRDGVIASLDPCREALPGEFYERWDSDYEAIPMDDLMAFGAIEQACVSIWGKLAQGIELAAEHSASEAYRALRRWSSNYLLHLGALVEGRSTWAVELDKFANLLDLVHRPPALRSLEEKRSIRELDKGIEELLDAVSGQEAAGTVYLSETVRLAGGWVREKLKPRTVSTEESGSVSLAIEFEGGERAILGAPMYLWLTRRAAGRLDARCFPQELLGGATDARVRAAAKGKYAFENDDVDMVIDTGGGEVFKFSRFGGEVDICHD